MRYATLGRGGDTVGDPHLRYTTVSFHNFKSQNFKLSVSNPKSKYVAYVSVLSRISNCQGLGRKNKFEILKTYRTLRSRKTEDPPPSSIFDLRPRRSKNPPPSSFFDPEDRRTTPQTLIELNLFNSSCSSCFPTYTYTCTHTPTHIHVYIYMYIHIDICIYVFIHVHIHTHTHTLPHTHTLSHTHTHTHIHIHIHTYTYTHI